MGKVSLVVRAVVDGKRINLSPEKAKLNGVTGTFYLRWTEAGQRKWEAAGTDASQARVAAIRKTRALNGLAPVVTRGVMLADAIEAFLLERKASQDACAVRRWRWELTRFADVSGKAYLQEVNREDVFAYWNSFKADGAKPRTIYNRIQALLTFLKNRGLADVIKSSEMPTYDEKDVDYYTETNPNELVAFFNHTTPEERLAFMFFLYSGCREREVMFACWQDIDFVNRTYTVRPKADLGFRTKNGLVRVVPLPQVLIDALKTYVVMVGTRRLIFVNSAGKAEGHFLYKCKQVAFRAGLNCGHCTNKKGLSCKDHAVCAQWSLHKFRRTWATLNLLSGMPVTMVQYYIGHSDMETLNRYIAKISAKTELAKQMADNMARMANIQGTVAADVMADAVKV